MTDSLGLKVVLHVPFETVHAKLPIALKTEGFGVLTEIDIKSTLAQKIGVTVPRYTIVGACNPQFAHAALQLEPEIGLMLPCNVVLSEQADGSTHAIAVDPSRTIGAAGRPALLPIATEVRARLERALSALERECAHPMTNT